MCGRNAAQPITSIIGRAIRPLTLWTRRLMKKKKLKYVKVLDRIQVMSNDLLELKNPASVYRAKPIKRAWDLLVEIGEHSARKVTIREPAVYVK